MSFPLLWGRYQASRWRLQVYACSLLMYYWHMEENRVLPSGKGQVQGRELLASCTVYLAPQRSLAYHRKTFLSKSSITYASGRASWHEWRRTHYC